MNIVLLKSLFRTGLAPTFGLLARPMDPFLKWKTMQLLLATHNDHKLREVKEVLPEIEWTHLKAEGWNEPIEERGFTLYQNALIKAETIFEAWKIPVLADDTGLVVPALGGAPGVYSARYAGTNPSFEANNNKLLRELARVQKREAHFKTVLALIDEQGNRYFLEGRVDGYITSEPRGKGGFGYDPLFVPEGYKQTFAQMTAAEKNQLSHRGRALQNLAQYLNNSSK